MFPVLDLSMSGLSGGTDTRDSYELTDEEDKAWTLIRNLKGTIKQLREYGVEPACPNEFLDKAEEDFKAHFYSFAVTHAGQGLQAAEGLLQAYTEAWNVMYYAYDDIQKARQYGNVSQMEAHYESAENHLSESRFEEAAKEANQVRRMVEDLFEKGEPNFNVELSSGKLRPAIWNRAKFKIKNTGSSHAKGVRMRVTGPVEIINLPEVHKLEAGAEREIEIGVKPKSPGEFPLEIWFKGISAATGKPFALFTRCWVAAPKEDMPPKLGEVEYFNINEIFLIYIDGRLISHVSRMKTSDMDEDILSSMMVAIRSFVRDSFKHEDADAALKTFSFSDFTVVIEKGNYLYLTVLVEGSPPPQLVQVMKRVMEKVEISYAGIIESWDGQDKHFKEAHKLLDPIFKLVEKVKMKRSKAVVKVRSGLEFYRGFVRLKVAVINETETIITDARLLLTYNKDTIRLDRVEPDYEVHGSTVNLDSIHGRQKKSVAYYLDPLICQESTIDCTLTYKDYKGNLQHVDMKRRPVDIVCPLFYTPQTLNIAMLKRLVKDLKERDSKIFAIEEKLTAEEAFEKTKDVLQRSDIRFVRELREVDPLVLEAWYYGRVQTSGEEMVIKVSSREDTRTIEVNVASQNLANQTGLLAELGHTVSGALLGSELVTDEEVRLTIEKSSNLLDKLSEAEASAGSTEATDLEDIMRRLRGKDR